MRRRDPDRRAATAIAAHTARRALRSGVLWGAVFGIYVASSALSYAGSYPTVAGREKLAHSLEGNAGISALIGPARGIATVAGFTAWRAMGVLTIVGAAWGLLLATRLVRGEEDAGRWELLLAGQTTRRRAAAQATLGLAAGLAGLWVLTAVITVAVGRSGDVGFPVGDSLYFATALAAGAVMAVAVGLLAGQLAATRRQANGVGAAFLGACVLVRMAGDSTASLAWLRWLTPLGWPEHLRPLTGGGRPLALIPIVGLTAGLAGVALVVAGRRDLGASALPGRDAPPPRLGLLGGPTRLAVRLGRPVAIGWLVGLAALGLMLGLIAQSASTAISGSAAIEKAIARLGGHRAGAASYLGIAFLTAAVLITFAAAGQIAATRAEEADGHLDHLLVRPVARWRWLAGRLLLATALITALSVTAGVFSWIGAATQHSGLGFGELLAAGVNLAPPGVFIVGIGALLYGLAPRAAPAITYTVVAWSFLVEFVGSLVRNGHLLLDTSVVSHVTPAPAADPNWASCAWLVGLGAAAALAGILAFDRRDLVVA